MESCSRCEKHPTPVIWIHPLCYNLLLSTYEPCEAPSSSDLERLARATQTPYQPPDEGKRATESAREGLFSPWAQPILQNSFNQVLFRSLPAEIQEIILTLTGPCWYLTLLGESRRLLEQVRNDWESQPEKLSLSQCVYIARTTYQGVSYISRISNIPFGDRPESECVVVPPGLHRIILSIDHIGVRQIQFLTADSHASQDHSPWYKVLDVQVDEPVLCVKSDVRLHCFTIYQHAYSRPPAVVYQGSRTSIERRTQSPSDLEFTSSTVDQPLECSPHPKT